MKRRADGDEGARLAEKDQSNDSDKECLCRDCTHSRMNVHHTSSKGSVACKTIGYDLSSFMFTSRTAEAWSFQIL